jgi:hypothetical protein
MPPRVAPKTARTIRTEDVDRGVKRWFEHVAAPHASFPDGTKKKVPIKFSAGERWVASADKGGIRDRNGQLILPVIHIGRDGFDPTNGSNALGANVPRLQVARLVSDKTTQLANLDQARTISQRRLRDSAVYEIVTVPFPLVGQMDYGVTIQASSMQQMNEITEKILSRLEFFNVPSFVISLSSDERLSGIKTGDGSTELMPEDDAPYESREPLSDYYFVGYLDGNWSNKGNLDDFTDQERIIELQFEFHVPVALMLDPEGTRPAVQVERTAFSVRMGEEETHFVDNSYDLDRIFGPK